MFRKLLTIIFVGISLFAPNSDQKSTHGDKKVISYHQPGPIENQNNFSNITSAAPELFVVQTGK